MGSPRRMIADCRMLVAARPFGCCFAIYLCSNLNLGSSRGHAQSLPSSTVARSAGTASTSSLDAYCTATSRSGATTQTTALGIGSGPLDRLASSRSIDFQSCGVANRRSNRSAPRYRTDA